MTGGRLTTDNRQQKGEKKMKNCRIQLKGVYSALFTIYDEELNVKKGAVHKLMKYHQENGALPG